MTADHASAGVGAQTPTSPWLVVGLGNPGPSYADTRHNVGHLVADVLAERMGASWRRHRTGRADTTDGRLGDPGQVPSPRLVVMKARSYMNESGGPVSAVASYESVEVSHVVAVHDELDLEFGALRVKSGGGDNGHNGLRSMRRSLGTGDFTRLRIGIGRPPGRQDPADYVLSTWSRQERKELGVLMVRAADAVETIALRGVTVTQNTYHA